jgi:hypothetical protein
MRAEPNVPQEPVDFEKAYRAARNLMIHDLAVDEHDIFLHVEPGDFVDLGRRREDPDLAACEESDHGVEPEPERVEAGDCTGGPAASAKFAREKKAARAGARAAFLDFADCR